MSSAKASQVIAKQLSEGRQCRKASSKVEIAAVCESLKKKMNFAFAIQCSFNAHNGGQHVNVPLLNEQHHKVKDR